MGLAQSGPLHCRPDDWGCSASSPWAQPGSLREGPQFYPRKNAKAEATARKRLVLGHAASPESVQPPRASGSLGWNCLQPS